MACLIFGQNLVLFYYTVNTHHMRQDHMAQLRFRIQKLRRKNGTAHTSNTNSQEFTIQIIRLEQSFYAL